MSIEWLIQPKRRCQTWLYLLSYLRYKWRNNEETGLISEKTSNPWAVYIEKSIDEFERGLTKRAVDVCQTCQDDDFCVGDYCPECGTRH